MNEMIPIPIMSMPAETNAPPTKSGIVASISPPIAKTSIPPNMKRIPEITSRMDMTVTPVMN